jgi:hypothetical protein
MVAAVKKIAGLVMVLGWFSPATAGPTTVPSLPLATDVSTVAIGSWSEYAISGAGMSGKVRWSVVARDTKGTTLEVTMPDAELGKGKKGTVVQRMVVGSSRSVDDAAIQVGGADPLALKGAAKQERFMPPDPATKTGEESVTVQAGTFSTAHYRVTTPQGTLDYWVAADKAPPLGVVKLTFTTSKKAKVVKKRAAGAVSIELAATGSDGKPTIVKKPLVLDAANLGAARAKLGVQPVLVKPVQPVVKPLVQPQTNPVKP